MEIKGTIALVTGASRGIGAATALELAAQGAARIILMARTRSDLEAVAEQVRGKGAEAFVYDLDLGDVEAVAATADAILKDVGVPDIVINNAGLGRWLFVDETTPQEGLLMTQVPYIAAMAVTTSFVNPMITRGSGRILFVNSPAGVVTWRGAATYTGARWALRGFAKAVRADLIGTGVGVTHFIAGKVTSNYFEANPGSEERVPGIAKIIPTMTPEETAQKLVRSIARNQNLRIVPFMLRIIYAFNLISPWMTGQVIRMTDYRRKNNLH